MEDLGNVLSQANETDSGRSGIVERIEATGVCRNRLCKDPVEGGGIFERELGALVRRY